MDWAPTKNTNNERARSVPNKGVILYKIDEGSHNKNTQNESPNYCIINYVIYSNYFQIKVSPLFHLYEKKRNKKNKIKINIKIIFPK